MVTGTRARQVNDQEVRGFGASIDRVCLAIERIVCGADDDVLWHMVTVGCSRHPYVIRLGPAPEGLVVTELGAVAEKIEQVLQWGGMVHRNYHSALIQAQRDWTRTYTEGPEGTRLRALLLFSSGCRGDCGVA
ncbi:hypothetical protein SALBM135S_00048 [Streptomyces alboniger]